MFRSGRAKIVGLRGVVRIVMIQRPASRTMPYIVAHTTFSPFRRLASRFLERRQFQAFSPRISHRHRLLYHSDQQRTAMVSMKAANRLKVAFDEGKGPSMGCW
jgi:Txe/YoeB family toxin of Txe-Axe toxin-antitoxin module